MHLRITSTGVRDGEYITSSPSGKQCSGSVFQVRGNYPPSKVWIDKMSPADYSSLEEIAFFSNMSVEQRKKWLLDNSVSVKDLYLDDTDIEVRIVKLSGSLFRDLLSDNRTGRREFY